MNKKISIFITSYNRKEMLLNLLSKLELIENFKKVNLLLILQDYDLRFINQIKSQYKSILILRTKKLPDSNAVNNTNRNVYFGFKYLFEKLNTEIAIHLEDDLIVSKDFINFFLHTFNLYKNEKKFFAINAFSRENKIFLYQNTYSKYYYGIGKGWGIGLKSWLIFKKQLSKSIVYRENFYFDSIIENLIKNNYYVIIPYFARSLEMPSNGQNVPLIYFSSTEYEEWKKSFNFIKDKSFKKYKYKRYLKNLWRNDCINYNFLNNLKILISKTID